MYVYWSRRLRVIDASGREVLISVGATVFNLRLTPDPAVDALADAIPRRHTNRRPLAQTVIPAAVLEELAAAARVEGAALRVANPVARGPPPIDRRAAGTLIRCPKCRHQYTPWRNSRSTLRSGASNVRIVAGFALSVLAAETPPAPPPAPPDKPSTSLVLTSAVIALSVVLVTWPFVKHAITIAHEAGHALIWSTFGARIRTVHVWRKGGLTTADRMEDKGFAHFFGMLAGYLGPSLFGLAGAVLLVQGLVQPMLWLSVVCLFLILIQTANPFGVLSVILTGTIIFFVARDGTPNTQTWFGYMWVWFLLIGGFWHIFDLMAARRPGGDRRSDAYQLQGITFLPASLWVGFFWLATLAALLYGAAILLGHVVPPADWPGADPRPR